MSVIVACDPGGIEPGTNSGTGYAVLDTETMTILNMHIGNDDPARCVDSMQALYRTYQADYVVCEGFKPRWGQPFSLDSVYLIGGLQAHFGRLNVPLPLVMPSSHTSKDPKKAAVPVPKLTALMKAQGYKVREGHSRMALSVAVYYAAFKLKELPALDFLHEDD